MRHLVPHGLNSIKNSKKIKVCEVRRRAFKILNFHCEPIESVSAQWCDRCNIQAGAFDNISICRYRLPTHWDIGKVYCRLIQALGGDTIQTLYLVYSSWMASKIDNYNIAVYYMSPEYLYESYKEGSLLEY